MTNEKYEFFEDCKEKAITARSARNRRARNGSGGGVKLPSDYLSEKQLNSLNGECKTYRLGAPMSWDEFSEMPNDLKAMYIKSLRKKFNVPDENIAEMMGISRPTFCKLIVELGLGGGKGTGGKRVWDEEGFFVWCGKTPEAPVEDDEIPVEIPNVTAEEVYEAAKQLPGYAEKPENETRDIEAEFKRLEEELKKLEENAPDIDEDDYRWETTECSDETDLAIPTNGEMTFQGDVDDILRTISKLLDGRQVRLEVEWEVLG